MPEWLSLPGASFSEIDRTIRMHTDDIAGSVPGILRYFESSPRGMISDFQCRKANLEDLFIQMTGRRFDE